MSNLTFLDIVYPKPPMASRIHRFRGLEFHVSIFSKRDFLAVTADIAGADLGVTFSLNPEHRACPRSLITLVQAGIAREVDHYWLSIAAALRCQGQNVAGLVKRTDQMETVT